MKKKTSILLILLILFSCFTPFTAMASEDYTFSLTAEKTEVNEGETFTVTLGSAGGGFDAYSSRLRYDDKTLELLSSTAPYTTSGNNVYLQESGNGSHEEGSDIATLRFGVRDISGIKRANISLEDAHADIAENAVSENAKKAAVGDKVKVKCSPVEGRLRVSLDVRVNDEKMGKAYAINKGLSGVDSVYRDDEVTFVSEAEPGYKLDGWRLYENIDYCSTNRAYSMRPQYDTIITAVFAPEHYDLNLDKAKLGFGYANELLPIEGYPAVIKNLPVAYSPVNKPKLKYKLYKGNGELPENEIPVSVSGNSDVVSFYMPSDTAQLTLTCSYRSGAETIKASRVFDVELQNAETGVLERMFGQPTATYASVFQTNTSVHFKGVTAFTDARTGQLIMYAGSSYNDGAMKCDGSGGSDWNSEPVRTGNYESKNAYRSNVAGNPETGLVWYTEYERKSVYEYKDGAWSEMPELTDQLKTIIGESFGNLKIQPFSSTSDMLIVVNEDAYHYDGSALTRISDYNFNQLQDIYRIDETRALIAERNKLYIYDNTNKSISPFELTGEEGALGFDYVIGTDFINGTKDSVFLRNYKGCYLVNLNTSQVTKIDVSKISGYHSVQAMNYAVDGYIYAAVQGLSAGSWTNQQFVSAPTSNIWRTADMGNTWQYVSQENEYDHEWAQKFEGNDETPATPDPLVYPENVTDIFNPVEGVTLFTGTDGACYEICGSSTISFDSNGGSDLESVTQRIRSKVSAPASPVNGEKIFSGWYTDKACADGNAYTFTLMPGRDITLYAKWSDDVGALDGAKKEALDALDSEYAKYPEGEYSKEAWENLTEIYESGKAAISEATSYDAIQQALEDAVNGMAAIEQSKTATVAVTIEKFTIDGDYIMEPTLATVDNHEKASIVITDLIKALYPKYHGGKPYRMTGTETAGFYLASIYDPLYVPDKSKGQSQKFRGFLSEFDGGAESGWMYCVNGSFPGVGASAWNMSNGDVMRWQYTCTGLGADIGADNSAWSTGESEKVADKDALIWRVAEINENKQAFFDEKEGNKAAYENALAVLKTITSSQESVDKALEGIGGKADTPEEKLKKAKTAAIKALKSYDPSDYREAERKLLEEYVSAGIEKINAASDTEGVKQALNDAKALINALVTKKEYEAIENASKADLDKIYKDTGDYMAKLGIPDVSSMGGEWMVLGLSRSGHSVPSDFKDGYYANVLKYVSGNIDANERLHRVKSTDHSRLILGLTSIGIDPRAVGGHNLLAALSDLEYVKKQGINGPIWALIALDSHAYEIPAIKGAGTQTTRDNLIETILAAQLDDGGWTFSGTKADTDMTAMAIQSLAPYYDKNDKVKAAVDKALRKLSSMQNSLGGFESWGTTNSESCAQVIVALTALGIDPTKDMRFVKNGNTVLQSLASFAVDGGGFKHVLSLELDGMATEQGYYAFTSYFRLKAGQTGLYDMTDVELKVNDSSYVKPDEKPHDDTSHPDATNDTAPPGRTATKTAASSKQPGKDDAAQKVIDAISALSKPDDKSKALPQNFAELTPEQETAIIEAFKQYQALSADDKKKVTNYDELRAMTEKLGDKYRYDEASKLDMRGNEEKILPWHIRLVVKPLAETGKEFAKLGELVGSDKKVLNVLDISFVDVLTGKEWHPEDALTLKLPVPELGEGYDSVVIAHLDDNDKLEYIEARIIDGELVFESSSFSVYATVAYNGGWDSLIGVEKADGEAATNAMWIWIVTAIIASICVAVTAYEIKRKKYADPMNNK